MHALLTGILISARALTVIKRILLNIRENFYFNEFKKIFGEKKGTDVVVLIEINYIKIIIT